MSLSVVTLFLLVRPVFAYEFHYDTTYVLRWGRQEGDADLVRCLHGQTVGYSMGVGCYKKGSYITLSLVLGDDPMDVYIIDWCFVYADLYQVQGIDANGNPIIGSFIMSLGASGSGEGLGKTYTLGPLPDHIEWAWMDVLCVLVYWLPGDPQPIGADTIGEGLELFIVLDTPRFPQDALNFGKDIPWVSVLRVSCDWARLARAKDEASILLTDRLWTQGHYGYLEEQEVIYRMLNRGIVFYTSEEHLADWGPTFPRDPLNWGEYFYLRWFLQDPYFPYGQCNDFADFLYCLIQSVGAGEGAFGYGRLLIDRTAIPQDITTGDFITWPIAPAGYERPPDHPPLGGEDLVIYGGKGYWWNYHQFVTYFNSYTGDSYVWDGTLLFMRPRDWVSGVWGAEPLPHGLPLALSPRETTAQENPPDYRDNLVRLLFWDGQEVGVDGRWYTLSLEIKVTTYTPQP